MSARGEINNSENVPHKYDKFLHSNNVPYAYIEVPIAFLSEELPTDATCQSKRMSHKKI